MECRCESENAGDAAPDWWLSSNNVQMGAFAVVGYLLYRFSQTLPALIRWPIRVFCSLTGLSALWGWVSHLVRTLLGRRCIHFKPKSTETAIWSTEGSSGSLTDPNRGSAPNLIGDLSSTSTPNKPGLRFILLGPPGRGRTSLVNSLLGNSEVTASVDVSTKRRGVVDGRELTVIDTPDVLGTSLENDKRATEALRSLQLTSPGPHAFLLVIQAAGCSMGVDQDAVQAVQATMELFGEGVTGHIIPVLTHADRLGQKQSNAGNLKRAVSMCGQTPVLMEDRPDLPPQAQNVLRRHLVGRVMEMKELKGLFVHELQRREDHLREELLADMSSTLAGKLRHV
ncbi:GTPase IMAP family member 9-like [Xenentodon cancila]